MDNLKRMFKDIRNDFRNYVPPLTETMDEQHHYEVWAEYNGKKTFFGKVVLHADTVEIAFYPDIDRETEWTLFPGDIFKRMENKFECEIQFLSPELQGNIKEVIVNLLDYFRENELFCKYTEFDS